MNDVLEITQNVARFAFRDQGRWDELRDLFHPNATIAVTWYSGSIEGFIKRSAQMTAASGAVTSKHLIGASRVTVEGNRALSDTDVSILARTALGPIEADVTCYLRFFDRFERRDDGIWRIASRTAIYEKDRIDPVKPSLWYPLVLPSPCRRPGAQRSGFSEVDHRNRNKRGSGAMAGRKKLACGMNLSFLNTRRHGCWHEDAVVSVRLLNH